MAWIVKADDEKGYRRWFVINNSVEDPWNDDDVEGPFDERINADLEADYKNELIGENRPSAAPFGDDIFFHEDGSTR